MTKLIKKQDSSYPEVISDSVPYTQDLGFPQSWNYNTEYLTMR